MFGGEAIAAGGFGCVFKPALKCKNSNKKFKGVSKLMFNRHVESEFNEINTNNNILKKIKNNKKYFISNAKKCKLDHLNNDDLINFNKKCKNLVKKGYTSDNINYNLNKLGILQLEDGGKDLNFYLENNLNYMDYIKINKSLIKLFKYGILKMNKYKLYHFDIKASNVLYKDGHSKLIDWGLSGIQKKNEIPHATLHRPFQFNSPFSNILFSDDFYNWYSKQIKNNKPFIEIANEWVIKNNNERGKGHLAYINDIINDLYNEKIFLKIKNKYPTLIKKYNYNYLIILNYIAKIFENFTDLKNKKFLYKKFFKEVFSKNTDIWGFLMCYKPLIHSNNKEIKNHIKNILNNYLYSADYASKPINTDKLLNDLEKINYILKKKDKSNDIYNAKGIKSIKHNISKESSVFSFNNKYTKKNVFSFKAKGFKRKFKKTRKRKKNKKTRKRKKYKKNKKLKKNKKTRK